MHTLQRDGRVGDVLQNVPGDDGRADKGQQVIQQIAAIPRARLYAYGAAAAFAILYLGWSLWGKRPQEPSQGFVKTEPAVNLPKVPGPVLTVPLKIVPKAGVEREFPEAHIEEAEEVIDTADVPPAPNGATSITTINTKTGEASTQIKIKEAPWFAFERTNYAGAGIEQHFTGELKAKAYYKRDILRIKDVHLQGELQIKTSTKKETEGFAGINVEYRF